MRSYINIKTLLQEKDNKKTMTSGASSQSQASYLNNIEEKPNQEASSTHNQLDQIAAATIMADLCNSMTQQDGEQFEDSLRTLNSLFQKGYIHLFMTHTLLMRKMMNHITQLGRQLENKGDDAGIQRRMLFVLSIIAQILKKNPKFYYPFTRKFLVTVFSIDAELLQYSPIKNQILAILAVIYENLSKQPKLVAKYSLQNTLKQAVLENYSLIEEIFTLKTMDKTISNMISKGISISEEEFKKYNVLETVTNFISRSQMQLFLVKMKMTMLYMSTQDMQKIQIPQ